MACVGVASVNLHPDWLVPEWSVAGVGSVMTTRAGGSSEAPFDHMNLRHGLGDDPAAVTANQTLLARAIGARSVYLNQVHGAQVVRLTRVDQMADAPAFNADAAFTTEPGVVCAVQVADCLPVLFAAPGGRGVGAAHAGWRGLAAGVLESTVDALCDAAGCQPAELQAWLGPCIGPRQFEVGADVLAAFGSSDDPAGQERFIPRAPGKWLANLPLLARDRLRASGVASVHGGHWCTVEERSRFFSFRRDGVTGRMAALVWIHGAG